MSKQLTEVLIEAVQTIERHQNYIFTNQKQFAENFLLHRFWKLTKAEFNGAHLNIEFLNDLDTKSKMQIPLFDYQAWRNRHV